MGCIIGKKCKAPIDHLHGFGIEKSRKNNQQCNLLCLKIICLAANKKETDRVLLMRKNACSKTVTIPLLKDY
jgi:hypothetical protein